MCHRDFLAFLMLYSLNDSVLVWQVTKLHLLVDAVTASYERYDFGEVGRAVYDFFWNDFADWYVAGAQCER